ncbi:hypothetical protein OSS47_00955 [Pseudomonas citronellolis]|uniref:lipopolysaccharide biosynthesis protein n=1 Tax=Pseudomonas citronellolis TaxID=53408 RepID=UPI002271DF32|nr:hypothetical protein [Pseudomonas citronellolis]WAB92582.1 hypothetical protein OSS47_00955 [Pseudomonas citronellolis]
MLNEKLKRLCNVGLRGSTLASKFLLVFFLARLLSPAELGLFGLLSATIGYSLYILGFDFYTFSTREILKVPKSQRGSILKNQASIFLVLYIIALPLLSIVFIKGLLPWKYAAWFFTLVILEHLTQELGRLLIAVSEQLAASIILFLRQGIWPILAVAAMSFSKDLRTLDFILAAWCIGATFALLLGVFILFRAGLSGWSAKVDWQWILRGLKVSSALLVATLAIRGVLTLDRYWVQSLSGLEVLGVYVLFISIGNALMSFLDAGVFSFIYPELIKAWHTRNIPKFRAELARLARQTLIVSALFFGIALLAIEPLLHWLGKDLYIAYQSIFPWTLLATTLYGVGMIPHYALYAMGYDRSIIYSHLLSLPLFTASTWLASNYSATLAVPVSICGTFLFILFWKSASLFLLRYELSSQNSPNTAKA